MKRGRDFVKRLAAVALATAVLCVCSWITVPFFLVPFTMQTFGVFCILLLLGGRNGTLAIALYLLLGGVGLPVFSGFRGGIGILLGPTGGYLIGFLLIGVCCLLAEPFAQGSRKRLALVLAAGTILCYAAGTIWFAALSAYEGEPQTAWAILTMCVLPFIPADAVKLALALAICPRIKKALRKMR